MKFNVRHASNHMSTTEQVELSTMKELKALHERLSDKYGMYPLIVSFGSELHPVSLEPPNDDENEIVVYDDYIE